ncbi:DUF3048 domain-containing protein [Candidatus Gottesmanbacteria bacterium]|nr:DUF3048 domain-containing protein [Candidatus Gottesmanbacteria bacterium]
MKKRSLPITILGAVIIYFLSTGISYGFFNLIGSKESSSVASPVASRETGNPARFVIDPNLPRTEECILNGMMYTKKEKDIWETRRPLAIMISNSTEGRPVAGISLADIVYEAVAEGGVTRFMPIYLCGASLGNINAAPVRSARSHFLSWVSEYDALYNHVGGSNRIGDNADKTDPREDALGQINQWGIKDLDQFGIGYPDCFRNPDRIGRPVATEHTMVCLTDNLYQVAEGRGWTNKDEDGVSWEKSYTSWKFKDDAEEDVRPENFSVTFGFWENYHDYDATWDYDKQTNSYLRTNGGQKQIDPETQTAISAKNVIVQFVKEEGPVDENKHMYYETIGEGDAIIFQDGKAIRGSWEKKNRLARTLFYDANGKEIQFNRGQIWIEVIPVGNKVTY